MTGVSVGKANIIVSCGTVKNAYTVNVVNSKSTDTVSRLKDKSGNQIYIRTADGKYVEATYADYYKDQKLYLRKADAQCFYTGWQTINGYTYFYDKNGKVVTGWNKKPCTLPFLSRHRSYRRGRRSTPHQEIPGNSVRSR